MQSMKNTYLVIGAVIIVILGIVGYTNKHQIKLLLMGQPSPTPEAITGTSPANPNGSTITGDVVTTQTSSVKGPYVADSKGRTLYIYDKDQPNVSNCSGACASIWPPYTTPSAPATLPAHVTTFTRTDGTIQFAYNSQPLYYYNLDKKIGDVNGDGVGKVWHLVKP